MSHNSSKPSSSRAAIERDLEAVEAAIGNHYYRMERILRERTSLKYQIRRHPIASFVSSVVLGAMASSILGKKGSKNLILRILRTLFARTVEKGTMNFVNTKVEEWIASRSRSES